MSGGNDNTTQLQLLIDRTLSGDGAYGELIDRAYQRLRRLAGLMLKNYPLLKRWEETDDVLQLAMLRLHRSLREVRPESVQHFFRLANTQIRRTLIDLARHYGGPQGHGANHQTGNQRQQPGGGTNPGMGVVTGALAPSNMPEDLLGWTTFHEAIERLPDEEREAFELVWYGGQTLRETAEVLDISLSTVVRRLNRAKLFLHQSMNGERPKDTDSGESSQWPRCITPVEWLTMRTTRYWKTYSPSGN